MKATKNIYGYLFKPAYSADLHFRVCHCGFGLKTGHDGVVANNETRVSSVRPGIHECIGRNPLTGTIWNPWIVYDDEAAVRGVLDPDRHDGMG